MKKTYFRKSIALLMAVALLIWLPCGALGDEVATPTDLETTEQGTQPEDNGSGTDGDEQIQTVQTETEEVRISEKTVFTLTFEAGASHSVAQIADENLLAEMKPVTEELARALIQLQPGEGQKVVVSHDPRKITGKVQVTITNSDPEHEVTVKYNTQEKKAEAAGSPFEVQDEAIIDHLILSITEDTEAIERAAAEKAAAEKAAEEKAAEEKAAAEKAAADRAAAEAAAAQVTDTKEAGGVDQEAARDPNKNYAPDGTEYNPDTGDTDKSGLYAVSGGAQGPSLDITKIVKTETVTTGNQGKGGSGSAGSVSTGSASKASTVVSSEGPDSENETGTENAETVDADYDGIYSVGGGYNVILVGLSEQMMQGETWPLLLQRGIVYEDYEQGEATPADAATLLQAGMEGVRKDENPGYWSSPGAATTPEEMINQFGFYGLMEREKQDTDSKALIDAALRLRDEGLIMNARRVPFFMDVQLTGNGGEGDTLRKLITELENDGLGGNTVLFFVPMGKETDKNPLVIVHPVILDGMTVKTPTKIEDVLATILTLSGNTNASQYEVLKTMPGRNLLMTEEFQGVEGLIPEVAEEAEAEEPAAPSGTAVSLPESRINLEKQGLNGTGMGDPEEKTRQQTETKNVNTHSAGPGEGTEETELLAPGSEIPVSEGPGGAGGSGQNASGPAAEETDQGPAHP